MQNRAENGEILDKCGKITVMREYFGRKKRGFRLLSAAKKRVSKEKALASKKRRVIMWSYDFRETEMQDE